MIPNKNIIKRSESCSKRVNIKPCHLTLRWNMRDYRGIRGREENGDNEGMKRRTYYV